MSDHPMIELRGVHRYFGATHAVNDVSFTVDKGCVFGYIGPNGAGKTTSMRILATLEPLDAGDAYVDGFSVVDDPDRVRGRLGFMPDYFTPYPNMDVFEYLDFFARAYGLVGRERIVALDRVMKFTYLDTMKHKPITGLSKGMKQRLCLGRTLIHDPPVLILDEPAAGLDPRARIELREMISSLAHQGKAILVSSHILTELAEMCDRVGIVEYGRMLAVGTVDEIQHGTGKERRRRQVAVQLLGGVDRLGDWLRARDDVGEVKTAGLEVEFDHSGELASEAALLREMVGAGFEVVAFGSKIRSLEDVFMTVTKGRVQ